MTSVNGVYERKDYGSPLSSTDITKSLFKQNQIDSQVLSQRFRYALQKQHDHIQIASGVLNQKYMMPSDGGVTP